MPNWVRNRMTVKFEKDTFKATGNGMQILNFIMKPLCTEECVFDFEKLIPIPDSYYADYDPSKTLYPSSALSERALQDYSDYVGMGKMPENMDAERHKAMFTIGKQSYDNYQRYGAANWYDWCCKYWGTKWDACHAERTEREDCVEIIFDTAWSTPTGIWERLFKYLDNLLKVGYPGINCTIAYADEDVGSNTGEIIYSAGNISFTEDSTYSDSIAIRFDESKTQKQGNLLRSVYVEPGKAAYEAEIVHNLRGMQQAVCGGLIEQILVEKHCAYVGNDEAKIIGMKGNRRYGKGGVIAGPFFICGFNLGEYRSLTDDEVKYYLNVQRFLACFLISCNQIFNGVTDSWSVSGRVYRNNLVSRAVDRHGCEAEKIPSVKI